MRLSKRMSLHAVGKEVKNNTIEEEAVIPRYDPCDEQ